MENRRQPLSQGKHKAKNSFDWRAKLFTVFISNLSRRVSNRALWEAFNSYGKYYEMMNAIKMGNKRKIDGRFIFVKKANYGWVERRRRGSNRDVERTDKPTSSQGKGPYVCDSRSYNDVRLSSFQVESGKNEETVKGVSTFKPLKDEEPRVEDISEVKFDFAIPEEELVWLECCIVGRLKEAK
ncbi:hypothetical protein DITRI_Ditri19aG0085500 [Diplodiscus trichospermus]